MDVKEVIQLLYAAEGPSRALDQTVAIALGWRAEETEHHSQNGGSRVSFGSTQRVEKVLAHHFMRRAFTPSTAWHRLIAHRGGAFWKEGVDSAKLFDNQPIQPKTPELALCNAVLTEIEKSK